MSEKRSYNKKGNPFQRGNTWTFIYYVTNSDGTRTQRWKGGYKTKKEAEEDMGVKFTEEEWENRDDRITRGGFGDWDFEI